MTRQPPIRSGGQAFARFCVFVTALSVALATLVAVSGLPASASQSNATPDFPYDTPVAVAQSRAAVRTGPLVPAADLEAAVTPAMGNQGHVFVSASSFVAPSRVPVCLRSFSADTEVLLGDGATTKPISELEVDDEVWATDPETGESGPRRVEAVWPHDDWLLELEVDGGSVTTTEDHHFWNDTDRERQETQHLDAGDLLLTPSGDRIAAGSLDWSTWHYDEAYDLTVEGVHTYYVSTGEDDVLVHNCDLDALSAAGRAADKNGFTAAGRAGQKHGNRSGSSFPLSPDRTAGGYNSFGQDLLDDLLTAPNTARQRWAHPVHGQVPQGYFGAIVVSPDSAKAALRTEAGVIPLAVLHHWLSLLPEPLEVTESDD